MNIVPVRAFSDNYIWILRSGDQAVAVDPGDAAPVQAFLQQEQLSLPVILITHHHFDHTGGVQALSAAHSPIVYGPGGSNIAGLSQTLSEGDAIEALGHRFEVIAVPGHTLDHIAYYCEQQQVLLCGDTLFSAGCGRLFEGSPAQMHRSLSKFAALPDTVRVYCTHEYTQSNLKFAAAVEPNNTDIQSHSEAVSALRRQDRESLPSSMALEKRINPFLRVADAGVKASAERWAGRPLPSDTEVLAALRQWKDGF